jgi:hypothetical protein
MSARVRLTLAALATAALLAASAHPAAAADTTRPTIVTSSGAGPLGLASLQTAHDIGLGYPSNVRYLRHLIV